MIKWMANFKIGSRIFAGFILILALLCALAFTGWHALTGASTRSDDYSHFATQVEDILKIQAQVADIRRTVRIYGFTGDEAAFTQTKQSSAKLLSALKAAQQTYRSDARRDTMGKAISIADDYIANFDKLKDVRRRRDDAETAMRVAGTAAIDKIEKAQEAFLAANDPSGALGASDLQVEAALTRLAALNYVATPTAPNAEAKVKILQQFATEVRREARNQAQNILQKVHRELDAILL